MLTNERYRKRLLFCYQTATSIDGNNQRKRREKMKKWQQQLSNEV